MAEQKKVKIQLVGLDGNAFSLMGAWKAAARRQGWTPEETKVVLDKCMSGDYNNLLCTLMEVSEDPDESEDEGSFCPNCATAMRGDYCPDCGYCR